MKFIKKSLALILIAAMLIVPLAGCGDKPAKEPEASPSDSITDDLTGASPSPGSDETGRDISNFSYSDGLDENGMWQGVKALDYVEMFDYTALQIPKSVHTISTADVNDATNELLSKYSTSEQVTDRAVVDGDSINIDFVGSIDGVEFDGGNTRGQGAEVTVGVTNYIDDFLQQLIGHTPGETVNVEVTFPDDYGTAENGNEHLNGKDAVFVTTINYIIETNTPDLTDDFVAQNFSANGWTNTDDFKAGIALQLQDEAVLAYVQEYLMYDVAISEMPEVIMEYQENSMLVYYEMLGQSYYGVDLETFISVMGVTTIDELLELEYDRNLAYANYYLVLQAIAENMGIQIEDADVTEYFGEDGYSDYEAEYGMPYLKQVVMCEKVIDFMLENVIFE